MRPKKSAKPKTKTRSTKKISSTVKPASKTTKPKTARKPRTTTRKTPKPAVEPMLAEPAKQELEKPLVTNPANEVKKESSAKPAPKNVEQPTVKAASEPSQVQRPMGSKPLKIPPILLEGDNPAAPPLSGPGQRFSLGPTPPQEKLRTEGELPQAYGTQHLYLTARDPHWLYAHWDLTHEQQRKYNAFSRDGHMVLRVYANEVGGNPAAEVHVKPDSNHWFVNVDRAGTKYLAELGYYSAAEKWTLVSTSDATLTPPDKVSADTSVEFTTIPLEVPLEKLLTLVKEAVQENPPLAQAMQELRDEHPNLPEIKPQSEAKVNGGRGEAPSAARPVEAKKLRTKKFVPPQWTPAQEQALAEIINIDEVRRVWMGSLEITELIRRQLLQELAAKAEAQLKAGVPTSPISALGPGEEVPGAITSPTIKPAQHGKGFWFNINAELIVYGATEADATVTIAGRKITLRRDGSFSYRFALPDGNYEMPIVAISADQTDGRAAELKFSRSTEYRGDVGAHPQEPSLQTPTPENF